MPTLTRIQRTQIQALANERIRCPDEESVQEDGRYAFLRLFTAYVEQIPPEDAAVLDTYKARMWVGAVQLTLFDREIIRDRRGLLRKEERVSGCTLPLFPWRPAASTFSGREDDRVAAGQREAEYRRPYNLRVPTFGWEGNGEAKRERYYSRGPWGSDLPLGVFHLRREAVPADIVQSALDYYKAMAAHENARSERLTALRGGLDRARTHKEAVALWPEAAEALPVDPKKVPLTEADLAAIRSKVTGQTPG